MNGRTLGGKIKKKKGRRVRGRVEGEGKARKGKVKALAWRNRGKKKGKMIRVDERRDASKSA